MDTSKILEEYLDTTASITRAGTVKLTSETNTIILSKEEFKELVELFNNTVK
jgi:hypothetical protein